MIVSTMSLMGQDVESFLQDYLTAMQSQDIVECYSAIRRMEKFLKENTEEGTEDYYLVSSYLASAYAVRENYEKAFPLLQQSYEYYSNQKETHEIIKKEAICYNLARCYSELKEDYTTSLSLLLEAESYSKSTINDLSGPAFYVSVLRQISDAAIKCNNLALAEKYILKAEKLFSKYKDRIIGPVGEDQTNILHYIIYSTHISVLDALMVNCARSNRTKPLLKYLDTAIEISNQHKISTYPLQEGLLFAIDALAEKGEDKSVQDIILRYVQDIHKFSSDSGEKLTDDDIVRMVGGLFLQPADSLGLDAAARSIADLGYNLSKKDNVSIEYQKDYTIFQSNYAYLDGRFLESLKYSVELLGYCTNDDQIEFIDYLSASIKKTLVLIDHIRHLYKDGQKEWPTLPIDRREELFSMWERIRNIGISVLGENGFDSFLDNFDPGADSRTFKYFTTLDESYIKSMCLVYDHHYKEAIIQLDSLFKYSNLNSIDYTNSYCRISEDLHRYHSVIDSYAFLDEVESFYADEIDIVQWAKNQRHGISLWGEYKTNHMIELMSKQDYETVIVEGKDVIQTKEYLSEIDSTYALAIILSAQSMLNLGQNEEALSYIEKCESIAKLKFPRWTNLWQMIYSNKVKSLDALNENEQLYNALCQQIDFIVNNEIYLKNNDNESVGLCTKDDIAFALHKLSQLDTQSGKISKAFEHLQRAKKELDENERCAHWTKQSVLLALTDCYVDLINQTYLAQHVDEAISLFQEMVELIKKENSNFPTLIYCVRTKPAALQNIISLLNEADDVDEIAYVEMLISEMHKSIKYYNNFPPDGHQPVDENKLIENQAFEYTYFAGDFSSIGNNSSAEYFYKKAIEYLEEYNIKREEYEHSLGNLSIFYSENLNDYLSAAECEYLRFKNLVDRKGLEDKDTQFAFGRVKNTIFIPFGSAILRGHAADKSHIDVLSDKESSLACCRRLQEIIKEIINEYGHDAYTSLSMADARYMNDYNQVNIIQDTYESLTYSDARMIEPLIYLYYNDIENAEKCAKEYLHYVLESDSERFAEDVIFLAGSFDDYGYVMYAQSMRNWAYKISLNNNDQESAELISAQIAWSYFRMGEMERAFQTASLGSCLFDFKNATSYIMNMITLARVSMFYADNDTALEYLKDGMDVYNGIVPESQKDASYLAETTIREAKTADKVYSSLLKTIMVDAYLSLKRYSEAKDLLSQEIDIYRDSSGIIQESNMSYASNDLLRLARINFYEGNYTNAVDILMRMYDYRRKYNYSTTDILDGLISSYSEMHSPDSTSKYLNLYIKESVCDYMKESSEMTADHRYMLWDTRGYDRIGMYGACCTRFDDGLPGSYYDLALTYKGFLLKYSSIIEANIMSSNDEDLKSAYSDYKIARMEGADDLGYKESLYMYMYSKHPEFYNLYTPPSWKDVKSSLQKKQAAVEFVITWGETKEENTYGALIITPKSKQPLYVNLCRESELTQLADEFQKASLVASRKNNPEYAGELMMEYNNKLNTMIWSKILPHVKSLNTIVFSPYGVLNQLNIEVACSKKCIRVSSTADILDNNEIRDFNGSVLYGGLRYKLADATSTMETMSRNYFFSDTLSVSRSGWGYLSGTKDEVNNINALLKEKLIDNIVYSEADGTELSFKKLSGKNIPIIHIATHGFYFNNELASQEPYFSNSKGDNDSDVISPMSRSGLIMSGGEDTWKGRVNFNRGVDNILLAEEIAGLYLPNTELLVMSACQTALGEIRGDGVYGLQRAFKLAGAKTMIMSLWEVNDDATKIMMTNLYEQLLSGLSKRDSFNYAIKKVREWNDNPYYWAAFIMLD